MVDDARTPLIIPTCTKGDDQQYHILKAVLKNW